jgi:ion channel-forming bestrophin family protein
MQTSHHYPALQVLSWTRRDILQHLAVATAITVAYAVLGWRWLAIPWLPMALLGTAVAFLTGFKNNASYDRLWEARRIWGAIVNASRTWGLMARDYVTDRSAIGGTTSGEVAAARRVLYHRHFAWLTAMRYALRESRAWEASHLPHNAEFRSRWFQIDEHQRDVGAALLPYLDAAEHAAVMASSSKAAQILALQSAHLERLLRRGIIEDFRHMEMTRMLGELLTQQGASERIKNFPYPRQYATMNLWFVKIFVVLVPLGMLQEFEKLGGELIWLMIPFSALAGWIFTTMEKIGEGTENPFEGSANDVPITQLSRMIEIDLRQMLGDADVPPPITASNGILT